MSAPCAAPDCGGKRNANKHLKGHPDYAHPYMDATRGGLQPVSAPRRAYLASDEHKEAYGVAEAYCVNLVARIAKFTDKSGDCWLWTGARNADGYGKMHAFGRADRVTRIVWRLANGAIPDDRHVLHQCDNPPCVRLDHLFLGTHSDNMADMVAKGRHNHTKATHCPQGHEYTESNTRLYGGRRYCRECHQIRGNAARTRRTALRQLSTKRSRYLASGQHKAAYGAAEPFCVGHALDAPGVCTGILSPHHTAPRGAFGGQEAAEREGPVVTLCTWLNDRVQSDPEVRQWALSTTFERGGKSYPFLVSPKGRAS